MKTAFCSAYSRWRRRLDLDDCTAQTEELEVFAPESGRKIPRRMTVLFLQLVLHQALTDRAIAVNLFYDAEDDCLRGLEYFSKEHEGGKIAWREFLPAPGCFAKQVLNELRWRIGTGRIPGEGILCYKYQGAEHLASAFVPNHTEFRVYFTDDRPPMRNKADSVRCKT